MILLDGLFHSCRRQFRSLSVHIIYRWVQFRQLVFILQGNTAGFGILYDTTLANSM